MSPNISNYTMEFYVGNQRYFLSQIRIGNDITSDTKPLFDQLSLMFRKFGACPEKRKMIRCVR